MVGRESTETISMVYVYRDSPYVALITTRLVEVGSPCAFRKAMIEAPRRHVDVASLVSNGFLWHLGSDPSPRHPHWQSQ